ncbi:MAG: hypothetical protein RMZ41_015335 [Nostoc sp. DedVER02]|uniref:hypothetical protein n=1 Tax=unclassified Nostoc TaxID=2593658 RepID=UPI002AD53D39|nr:MULTISPECIES: hypothetical protein [unclassified Nostoc]MDZ7988266.1 hypothetical protein [Nostoc sp. DedVER02]MDZ8113562.1 hypothetical protein [Nostoc sp. DedVER01b]
MFQIIRQQSSPRWNITEDLAGYMLMMPTILALGTFVVLSILYAVFGGNLSDGAARYTPNSL